MENPPSPGEVLRASSSFAGRCLYARVSNPRRVSGINGRSTLGFLLCVCRSAKSNPGFSWVKGWSLGLRRGNTLHPWKSSQSVCVSVQTGSHTRCRLHRCRKIFGFPNQARSLLVSGDGKTFSTSGEAIQGQFVCVGALQQTEIYHQ